MSKLHQVAAASGSTSFKKLNPALFNVPQYTAADALPRPGKRLRQDTKPLMNKLESEWFAILQKSGWMTNLRAQAKRYRLGNGIWFKPDATGRDTRDGRETAYEIKGPHAFRGGFENLKVAATTWSEVRWLLVWKDHGEWRQQEVLP